MERQAFIQSLPLPRFNPARPRYARFAAIVWLRRVHRRSRPLLRIFVAALHESRRREAEREINLYRHLIGKICD